LTIHFPRFVCFPFDESFLFESHLFVELFPYSNVYLSTNTSGIVCLPFDQYNKYSLPFDDGVEWKEVDWMSIIDGNSKMTKEKMYTIKILIYKGLKCPFSKTFLSQRNKGWLISNSIRIINEANRVVHRIVILCLEHW
jgi:hypothetical protein